MNDPLENFSYRADIEAKDAWELLHQDEDVILVDVRTSEEFTSSGYPDLADNNKKLIKCTLDYNFENNLEDQITNKTTKILFICGAGIRSKKAANLMTKNGYSECYNVIGGIISWKNSGLLWTEGLING
jgi:rhodanese-related sulfurtransferase